MTPTEIQQTTTYYLKARLALVEYSTIPHQKAEGEAINAELARRAA